MPEPLPEPLPEPAASFVRRYSWELGWGVWAVANIVWMEAMQDWISIPFHFIWVSFTLLYGFRAWRNGLTWALAAMVVVFTGVVLLDAWTDGSMSADEMFEVPLMFGMFLAMMLHTTRRRAALEENARVLERERLFVQNASHALRSPITVALAHAEMLQLTTTDPAAKHDLGVVVDEIGRLRRLANRLLLLATAEAPVLPNLLPIEVASLVADVTHRWAPVPRRWSFTSLDEATVDGDSERLTLALDTLLENAVKVTAEGGAIQLAVRRDAGSAVIEVSDDGPGIPPALLESIFDRFVQGAQGAGPESGFGLGLSIVRAVAEQHGGSAGARNRPEGGAVFTLRLPLSTNRERPAHPADGDESMPSPAASASRQASASR